MAYKGFDLSGKVSLITGGNGGIGFGMADALAEAGADVCIWGTNPTKNAAAAEKLKRHGRKVHGQIVDVGDEKQVSEAFAETVKVMGHVDNCVANSGVGTARLFWRWLPRMAPRCGSISTACSSPSGPPQHMVERGKAARWWRWPARPPSSAARSSHGASRAAPPWCALAVELARYKITANSSAGLDRDRMPPRLRQPEVRRQRDAAHSRRRWGVGADWAIAVYRRRRASSNDGARLRHRWRLYVVLVEAFGKWRTIKKFAACMAIVLVAAPCRRRPRPPSRPRRPPKAAPNTTSATYPEADFDRDLQIDVTIWRRTGAAHPVRHRRLGAPSVHACTRRPAGRKGVADHRRHAEASSTPSIACALLASMTTMPAVAVLPERTVERTRPSSTSEAAGLPQAHHHRR
jgi:hypothetical protein